jgi:lysine 2,3-aminomutase
MDAIPAKTAKTLQTAEDFQAAGLIPAEQQDTLRKIAARYAAAVTPHLHDLILRTDRDGPIARQFVPSALELVTQPLERSDPIGDEAHSPVKGIVHRYPDRVLLMPTRVCAVYCRFCFRREAVGPQQGLLSGAELDAALDYIARTPAVWEVILTGGDPLILSSRRLAQIAARLADIPHVQVLRVHTRVPIAAPDTIDSDLIAALKRARKTTYVAVHCNHAAELTPDAVAACRALADAGCVLLSQSVLLRGVNDSVEALADLLRGLVVAAIKPYYLHQLDLAPGTSHFRVPLAEGQALIRALKARVSGIAMPTYVLDIPDGHGKVPVGPSYIHTARDGHTVTDPRGRRHAYPPRE